MAYEGAAMALSDGMREAAGVAQAAATTARRFSRALDEAQEDAREARKDAERAIERADDERRRMEAEEDAAAQAQLLANSHAYRENLALAAGPAGAVDAETAAADRRAAEGEAADCRRRAAIHRERLGQALDDLEVARKRGRRANDRADDAARDAAAGFDAAAAGFSPPVGLPVPVVPVAPTPSSDPNALVTPPPLFGSPFGRTPGDVRRWQIALEEQRRRDEAEQRAKDAKGSIGDGIKGAVAGYSLGLIDLGGNKDSARYRGGMLASDLNPKGVIKAGLKKLGKEAVEEGAEQAAKRGAKEGADDAVAVAPMRTATAEQMKHVTRRVGSDGTVRVMYKGVTLRNGHLAGKVHPETGVPFKETGFPDFSIYATKRVEVDGLVGDVRNDFAAATKAAGLERVPSGYTWHHVEDGRTMELVPKDIHRATGHTGGAELIRRGLEP
jgi:hypothetical protein